MLRKYRSLPRSDDQQQSVSAPTVKIHALIVGLFKPFCLLLARGAPILPSMKTGASQPNKEDVSPKSCWQSRFKWEWLLLAVTES
ncbi:hypothetical protein WJX77_011448 [Trebouxia sp. C0004]